MSVKTIRPTGNLGSAQTERNRSAGVWYDCPYFAIKDGELAGAVIEFDALTQPITPPTTEGNWGEWAAFTDTGGTITAGTGQGGELVLASDGDNEGASIRSVQAPFKLIRSAKQFWFEARVKKSAITDSKNGFFLGLTANTAFSATVPIAAAGTLADINLVGWHNLEADGDQIDAVYKADGVTQVTVLADALPTALVADTYVKLGMRYTILNDGSIADPNGAGGTKYVLSFLVNGIRVATKQIPSAAGTDFPNDVGLGLAFAVLNATGSTPGTNTLDYMYAAQLF